MDNVIVENDIHVLCVRASSFPDGVMQAYKTLHELLSGSGKRRYFGISQSNGKGEIIYKAAAEELNPGEATAMKCEQATIRKGKYLSKTIPDFMSDLPSIGKTFQEMLAEPEIDPQGYCLEWYLNETDVRCMVPLKD